MEDLARKRITEIVTVRKAVTHIAERLREQADSDEWGTQYAVAKWLGILADDLYDVADELKRQGIK